MNTQRETTNDKKNADVSGQIDRVVMPSYISVARQFEILRQQTPSYKKQTHPLTFSLFLF